MNRSPFPTRSPPFPGERRVTPFPRSLPYRNGERERPRGGVPRPPERSPRGTPPGRPPPTSRGHLSHDLHLRLDRPRFPARRTPATRPTVGATSGESTPTALTAPTGQTGRSVSAVGAVGADPPSNEHWSRRRRPCVHCGRPTRLRDGGRQRCCRRCSHGRAAADPVRRFLGTGTRTTPGSSDHPPVVHDHHSGRTP